MMLHSLKGIYADILIYTREKILHNFHREMAFSWIWMLPQSVISLSYFSLVNNNFNDGVN